MSRADNLRAGTSSATPHQSAYLMNYSTKTAMLKVVSDVFDSADTGQLTILALLDLSAAFDTVDHGFLLQRLHYSYDIGGVALRWIQSLLTYRAQVVNFVSQQSSQSAPSCGVPQSSVSGPFFSLSSRQTLSA